MACNGTAAERNNTADVENFGKLKPCVRPAQRSVAGLFLLKHWRRIFFVVVPFCVLVMLATNRRISHLDLGRLADLAGPSWDGKRAAPARGPPLVLVWNKAGAVPADEPFRGCPVTNCRSTTNRSLLAAADAVIFHGHTLKMDGLPAAAARRPGQHFVFFLQEPPTHVKAPIRRLLNDFFTLSISFHRDADFSQDYGHAKPGRQAGATTPFENRTRPVAWVVSNCNATSGRNEYFKELSKHIDIDVHGNCEDLKKMTPKEGRLSQCPLRKKGAPTCYPTMARDHFFYLAFENSRCRDYITEKFWHSLRTGMVPVVLGPSREQYRRVAPPDSFLHVADFISPAHLARRLKELMSSRDKFERLLAWRDRYKIANRRGLCDLCVLLQTPHRPAPINISYMWDVNRQCEPRLS